MSQHEITSSNRILNHETIITHQEQIKMFNLKKQNKKPNLLINFYLLNYFFHLIT